MKIQLPHRKVRLDASLAVEEKKKLIKNLLEENIEFHNQTMTLEEYLTLTWNKQKSKTIMDLFAYYLTKESKDLSILSTARKKEMEKGAWNGKEARYSNFSDLTDTDKLAIGMPMPSENNSDESFY